MSARASWNCWRIRSTGVTAGLYNVSWHFSPAVMPPAAASPPPEREQQSQTTSSTRPLASPRRGSRPPIEDLAKNVADAEPSSEAAQQQGDGVLALRWFVADVATSEPRSSRRIGGRAADSQHPLASVRGPIRRCSRKLRSHRPRRGGQSPASPLSVPGLAKTTMPAIADDRSTASSPAAALWLTRRRARARRSGVHEDRALRGRIIRSEAAPARPAREARRRARSGRVAPAGGPPRRRASTRSSATA